MDEMIDMILFVLSVATLYLTIDIRKTIMTLRRYSPERTIARDAEENMSENVKSRIVNPTSKAMRKMADRYKDDLGGG